VLAMPRRDVTLYDTETPSRYDVVISYVREDQRCVNALERELTSAGYSVYKEDAERTALWSADSGRFLRELYQERARCCLILVSEPYFAKRWTSVESRTAQETALRLMRPSRILQVMNDTVNLSDAIPSFATPTNISDSKGVLRFVQNAIAGGLVDG
jgi:hypothetical protein